MEIDPMNKAYSEIHSAEDLETSEARFRELLEREGLKVKDVVVAKSNARNHLWLLQNDLRKAGYRKLK